MNELPTPEDRKQKVRRMVSAILDKHIGQMFIDLDELHTHFALADEDIIEALREMGWDEEADGYQEMIAEMDPSRDYRDPTPWGEELVTDPMDSESNRLMEKDLKSRKEQQ